MFELMYRGHLYQIIELSQYGDKMMFSAQRSDGKNDTIHTGSIYTRNKEMLRVEMGYDVAHSGLIQTIPVDAYDNINWIKDDKANLYALGSVVISYNKEIERLDVLTLLFEHQKSSFFDDHDKLYFKGGSLYACCEMRLKDNSVLRRAWFKSWNGKYIPEWVYYYRGVTITKPVVSYRGI